LSQTRPTCLGIGGFNECWNSRVDNGSYKGEKEREGNERLKSRDNVDDQKGAVRDLGFPISAHCCADDMPNLPGGHKESTPRLNPTSDSVNSRGIDQNEGIQTFYKTYSEAIFGEYCTISTLSSHQN
jgi:hypothetical protein